MNPEVLEKISKLDWIQIYQKMTAVSVFWSKIYCGGKWKLLPKGYTQEDIVQESIRRAFSRNWDHFDEEEILNYLFGACRSIVSNLVRSANIQMTEVTDLFSLQDISGLNEDIESKFEREDTLERIRVDIGEDVELQVLFEGILIGLEYKEIASKLNTAIEKVYSLKKRLIRIIERIAKEIDHDK